MAMLKLLQGEPRDLSGLGLFKAGEARPVPDVLAAALVTANPDLWAIEVPEKDRKARQARYAGDRELDKKEEKVNSHE